MLDWHGRQPSSDRFTKRRELLLAPLVAEEEKLFSKIQEPRDKQLAKLVALFKGALGAVAPHIDVDAKPKKKKKTHMGVPVPNTQQTTVTLDLVLDKYNEICPELAVFAVFWGEADPLTKSYKDDACPSVVRPLDDQIAQTLRSLAQLFVYAVQTNLVSYCTFHGHINARLAQEKPDDDKTVVGLEEESNGLGYLVHWVETKCDPGHEGKLRVLVEVVKRETRKYETVFATSMVRHFKSKIIEFISECEKQPLQSTYGDIKTMPGHLADLLQALRLLRHVDENPMPATKFIIQKAQDLYRKGSESYISLKVPSEQSKSGWQLTDDDRPIELLWNQTGIPTPAYGPHKRCTHGESCSFGWK